jgi:hypothetical protein
MKRLSNSWRLCRASWRVLSRDRELVAVPIVAGTASLLVFVLVAGSGLLLLGGAGELDDGAATKWALWLLLALATIGATWVAAIGQAAIVAGAGQRMEGGDPALESAFAVARSRVVRLLEWAILATAVALVIDQIERRFGLLGRVAAWLGNVAFSVLSFLALPVIVFEDVGAIEAFKRSSALLRDTWGEQVAFSFGIGLLGFLVALPALVFGGIMLASEQPVVQILGVAAAIVWIVLVLAVASALSAVFKTALYRYARGLPVDASFKSGDLAGAFQARHAR